MEAAPDDAGANEAAGDAEARPDVEVRMPDTGVVDCAPNGEGQPVDLACTNLYAAWSPDPAARKIASDVVPYTPAFVAWNDGAESSRWIRMPAGTAIDTGDMNDWIFPAGTQFWQEIRIGGARVETRYATKGNRGWYRTTYLWTPDGAHATEARGGAFVGAYEVPAQDKCAACHAGKVDGVLGFEAIALGNAGAFVGGGAPGANLGGIESMLTGTAAMPLTVPSAYYGSVIPGMAPALGWLHANCGVSCHNRNEGAMGGTTMLFLRLNYGALDEFESSDTFQTTVQIPSYWQPPNQKSLARLRPGDPDGSTIVIRAGVRDGRVGSMYQMPPLATHVVDAADVHALQMFVAALPP
jgi:hypothetical protein